MKRALLCLLCLFLLSFAACQKVPSAASPSPSPSPLPVPSAAVPSEWPELPVYIDGLLRLRAYDCEGTLFLCPEDVCALFDLPAEAEIGENGCRLQLEAWTLEAPAGESIFTADGSAAPRSRTPCTISPGIPARIISTVRIVVRLPIIPGMRFSL